MQLAPRPEVSLPEMLAHRARTASDLRLALDAGGGALATIAVLIWHPAGWWPLLASAALCFASFGIWGIADRELADRAVAGDAVSRALRAVRVGAAVLGGAAAAMLLFGMLGVALGTWIS